MSTESPARAEGPVRKVQTVNEYRARTTETPQVRNHGLAQLGSLDLGEHGVLVASQKLIDHVLRTPSVFSSYDLVEQANTGPQIPLGIDPPEHARYRKFLDPLFNPRRVDALDADIRARANGFIDTFVDRGSCDFTAEFAEVFPASVFLSLMGLPWEELDALVEIRDGLLRPGTPEHSVEERRQIQKDAAQHLYAYFGKALDERAANPGADLLSSIATGIAAGTPLSRDEMLGICFLMITAGLDTVTDSLTCFFAYLAQHPEQRQRIVEHPELIPNAVEELLRWETPVSTTIRWSRETCPLGDVTVPAGHHVIINLGSANVDPVEWENPMEVDFDRAISRHLSFGGGVHRCLGSHLARRELRIAMREFHRRIPEYRLSPGYEVSYLPPLRFVPDLQLSWTT